MERIKIFTIGFTKTKAEQFFEELRDNGVKRIIDVRLNNISQLAGFTKKDDLEYFLKELYGIDYVHLSELAPTKDILDEYKKNKGEWADYEKRFLDLMEARKIEQNISKEVVDNGCMLCSEDTPTHCHRRLVVEYLEHHWGDIDIKHLLPSERKSQL